ncbi:MAG: response regulator [Spirochaetaceae bacterium]
MKYDVIIIDDEPWSRQIIKSLAEWDNLNLNLIAEAEDSIDGITKITELNPQILITDMQMPGMSGSDFLKLLEVKFPELQIIVISGYDDFSYLQQAIRSGAIDYLLKPVDPVELNKTLIKCINRLNEQKQQSDGSIIFNDPVILDEYIKHRKRVFGYLLELDILLVEGSLKKLYEYLSNTIDGDLKNDVEHRVLHDFTIMLEEFTTRFGLDTLSLDTLSKNINTNHNIDIFLTILDNFNKTITVIKEFQLRKGFLSLSDVKKHIDHYYQEVLSLETISKLFLVSKEHMSRSFKKEFNITLNEYITKLRMNKAKELIIVDGVEIKQVAFLCGYTDLAYFYRVFKKFFGIPPGQMRK